MAQAIQRQRLTITAAYEPRARSSQARTKSGTLRKQAWRWCNGLAWSTKLQALEWRFPHEPPYGVTVHSYLPPPELDQLPSPREWFECISIALSMALDVEPAQLCLQQGRLAHAPPFSLPYFEIVVTASEFPLSAMGRVICPGCGAQWRLGAALHTDDRCPYCDHEGAGLPFVLGLL